MAVKHVPFGDFVNQSERLATEAVLGSLQQGTPSGSWFVLTNFPLHSDPNRPADEVDIVLVGPPGIRVIEVKHWDRQFLERKNSIHVVETEADKLQGKTKKIASLAKRYCDFEIGFVEGVFLLTRGPREKFGDDHNRRSIHGSKIYGLAECQDLCGWRESEHPDWDVEKIVKTIAPSAGFALDERPSRFGEYVDLEPLSTEDPFRRLFRARHRQRQDHVILHLYDLTASKDRDAREIAEREYEAIRRLQKSPWIPNIMESFQDAPHYPGEICFFSLNDPDSPTLGERSKDDQWSEEERRYFARQCFIGLAALHVEGVIHRNLTPDTIRVRSSNEPLFTEFQYTRLPGAQTLTGRVAPEFERIQEFVAPEVLAPGLASCNKESDTYSLCASLKVLLNEMGEESPIRKDIEDALELGLHADPASRYSLGDLASAIEEVPKPAVPTKIKPQYWDQDVPPVEFRGRHYKVVEKLGAGSIGITFKVIQVDPRTHEQLGGHYVAKVILKAEVAKRALAAYRLVKAHSGAQGIATVFDEAEEWMEDGIAALMQWCDGDSFDEFRGGFLIEYLQDLAPESPERGLLRWIREICIGLSPLHHAGLVHGDLSPRNLIVNGDVVVLTDFDLSTKVGESAYGGTPAYCSPEVDRRDAVSPSDDLFALAASVFHVLFGKSPFVYGTQTDKLSGLNWKDVDRDSWGQLGKFLDRATQPSREDRFPSAMEAKDFVEALLREDGESITEEEARTETPQLDLRENQVPWLTEILNAIPSSPKGNVETRGLDSEFAQGTYVETELDKILAADIRDGKVNLIILCGNAGDGKTAFLQNLSRNLGGTIGPSSKRIWTHTLPNGVEVRANLDGAASYEGLSAKDLLDEFFGPFLDGVKPDHSIHLVAINDGPLLEWMDRVHDETPGKWLISQFESMLSGEIEEVHERIRFIDLNSRSLVGGIEKGTARLNTHFLNALIDKMLGPDSIWNQCETCLAKERCHAKRSVDALRDPDKKDIILDRLARALQAVHLRGEIHITARELRGALAYIFFGTEDCQDLHKGPNLPKQHFWDRAFDPESNHRQGEVLKELTYLDPAFESHPRLDRELLKRSQAERKPDEIESPSLHSLRRKAYFEWTEAEIERFSGNLLGLDIMEGDHISKFIEAVSGENSQDICAGLCAGLARLEELPESARKENWVPLHITPRTPTETAFWVEKQLSRFSLSPASLRAVAGLENLPNRMVLTYTFDNGHKEHLYMGLELFSLLLDLKDGVQLTDSRSDEVFANLTIFKQRLVNENDRVLYAWNPRSDQVIEISIAMNNEIQHLVAKSL